MSSLHLQDTAWARARHHLFAPAQPSASPVLLSVGAQPGAGKTRALAAMLALHPGQDLVPVIGDDLRQFHPDYKALSVHPDPEVMPAATAELSGWLVGRALEHAATHGYSTAVEGTLRRPETTLATMQQFAQAGASTHLVVLGVSPFDSWTGCIDRYLTMRENGRAARWTPLSAHEAGLNGAPLTLQAATTSPHVHRISVTDRSGTLHYDSTRIPEGTWHQSESALAALTDLRNAPTDPAARMERVETLTRRANAVNAPATVHQALAHARTLTTPPPRTR